MLRESEFIGLKSEESKLSLFGFSARKKRSLANHNTRRVSGLVGFEEPLSSGASAGFRGLGS